MREVEKEEEEEEEALLPPAAVRLPPSDCSTEARVLSTAEPTSAGREAGRALRLTELPPALPPALPALALGGVASCRARATAERVALQAAALMEVLLSCCRAPVATVRVLSSMEAAEPEGEEELKEEAAAAAAAAAALLAARAPKALPTEPAREA